MSWALGWITVKGKSFRLPFDMGDVAFKLRNLIGGKVELEEDGIVYKAPEEIDDEIRDARGFLRGVFEAGGVLSSDFVILPLKRKLRELEDFEPEFFKDAVILKRALDFLIFIYDDMPKERSEKKFKEFLSFISRDRLLNAEYELLEGAVAPFKKHASDSGWDLFLVEVLKDDGNVVLLDTKVKLKPPRGYYFELVPRSSLSKSGFVLANSIGVIDATYRGTVKVALARVSKDAKVPKLPWRAVQLILRPLYCIEFKEVKKISGSLRGEGGFGSTG